MKKGFTLIELLAVILILGIIVLIAIPTVNKIISEARYGAFKSGNENIMKQVEQDCQTSIIKGETPILSYLFTEGKSSNEINIKGTIPNNGYILMDKNCTITNFYLLDDKIVYSNKEDVREDYMLKASSEESKSIFYSLYESYLDKIISINFINNLNIPENAIEIKDPSISGNNKIRSWLIPNEEFYDLYVGSFKTIYSNYDSSYLFKDFILTTNILLNNFNTSFTKKAYRMFQNDDALKSLDLSNWDTSNFTNISGFLYSCHSLKSIDLSNFNTSNISRMDEVFRNCTSLESINIGNWDTSNVTSTYCMFNNCIELKYLDVSKWKFKKINNMRYMFYFCKSLTNIDVYNWDVSNATDLSKIFERCYSLTNLDLSNWDTSNARQMEGIFYYCSSLKKLNLSNWTFSNVDEYGNLFENCYELNEIIFSDYSSVVKLEEYFPSRIDNSVGIIKITGDKNGIDTSLLSTKNWNII